MDIQLQRELCSERIDNGKVPFPLSPPAELIARAKFSSRSLRNAHGRKNLLSFLSHTDKRDFNYYLCRRMAAEWRFLCTAMVTDFTLTEDIYWCL